MTLDFGRTDTVKVQEKLLAGSTELLSEYGITLISGQNLTRGAPLGRITASGKYTEWDPNVSDGSETLAAILAEDVDASSGDEKGVADHKRLGGFAGLLPVIEVFFPPGPGLADEGDRDVGSLGIGERVERPSDVDEGFGDGFLCHVRCSFRARPRWNGPGRPLWPFCGNAGHGWNARYHVLLF